MSLLRILFGCQHRDITPPMGAHVKLGKWLAYQTCMECGAIREMEMRTGEVTPWVRMVG